MKLWKTEQEIRQQPVVWAAWGEAFSERLVALRSWVAQSGATEIWLCGAGTSAFIGDIVASGLGARSALPLRAIASTDLVSAPHLFRRAGVRPLVVSFGRSGDSAESIGTLDVLDALWPDAPRLNITCNAGSVLATRSGFNQRVVVLPEETHDAGFAMTASFSTMLLTALGILDPDFESRPDAFVDRMHLLSRVGDSLLNSASQWAETRKIPSRLVVLGSGPLAYAAREAALKVMELSAGRIPALWESMLGFRHGPKAFVNEDTPILGFMSSDPHSLRYDTDLMAELALQFPHASTTCIGTNPTADLSFEAGLSDVTNTVLYVMVAQLLAVHWAKSLNLNVDNPFEGQATLTRVVSGVTLYPLGQPDG
ncbi:tagatose-bisphosphate aldolase [Tateyamaria pelophila]|uniref:tagatose-bisphosphate aldolase n=1 Tax=Tateyamaria pelophila TaxID=328415 RepID=UPI001CBA922A|nr:tagatose-bisphosphate aldolase [Tateyamaria pelophila]